MTYTVNFLNDTNDSNENKNVELDLKKMVCIRSYGAGVFVGELEDEDASNRCVILKNCRRIWYWDGAASLSQLAEEGVKKSDECKFPKIMKRVKIFDVLEIINMPREAVRSIYSVKEWRED